MGELPPPIVDARPVSLAEMGRPEGFVLTRSGQQSASLRYRVPTSTERDGKRFLRIELRARIELEGDHGEQGSAALTARTSDRTSLSIDFGPVRRQGRGFMSGWASTVLHGSFKGLSGNNRFAARTVDYARIQAATPGVHTLRFGLEETGGIKVRRVAVSPESRLYWTRQPPQALAVTSRVVPARPAAGSRFVLRFRVKNFGTTNSGPVSFAPIVPKEDRLPKGIPAIRDIGPGSEGTADMVIESSRLHQDSIETLASSRVGQAVATTTFRTYDEPVPSSANAGIELPKVLTITGALLAMTSLGWVVLRVGRR